MRVGSDRQECWQERGGRGTEGAYNGVIITVRFSEHQNTCCWPKAIRKHHRGRESLVTVPGHLDRCPIFGCYEQSAMNILICILGCMYFGVGIYIHFSWKSNQGGLDRS